MKFRVSAFKALILFPIIALPGLVYADSFDQAVNEYIKGYKECTEANSLSSKNLASAQRKFSVYLDHLKRATAIDKSILTSNKRGMEANLRYCERVETTLKKLEGTPILEKGFTSCDAAQKSLEAGDITKAQSEFEQFNQYRNQALTVSESLMDVFSLSSQMRSCDRLGEKINVAFAKQQSMATNMDQAIKDATSTYGACQQAKTILSAGNFNLNNLPEATKLLDKSNEMARKLKVSAAPLQSIENPAMQAQKQQLTKLTTDIDSCNAQSSKLVQTYTNTKTQAERDIRSALNQLTAAQKSCDAAKQISSKAESPTDIANAKNQYNSSQAQLKKATDKSTQDNAKTLSGSSLTTSYNKAVSNVESCQRSALQSVNTQDAAIAADIKQQQERQQQALKEQEAKQKAAEQKVSKIPETEAPKPDPKATTTKEAPEEKTEEPKSWSRKVDQFRP